MILLFFVGALAVLLFITGWDNSAWIAVLIGALLAVASLVLEEGAD